MSEENMESTRRYLEEFNAAGLSGTNHLRHPDWELLDAPELPDADRYVGAEATARVQSFIEAGWDGKFNVEEYIDAGDEVIVVWRMNATSDAGISLGQTLAFAFLFEDQKVRRVQQFMTKNQALEAAGLSE
jgi:ketosteroid isomerase-like protein